MKNTNIDKLNYIIKIRKIEIENIEKLLRQVMVIKKF
jgi:hypothetical protein